MSKKTISVIIIIILLVIGVYQGILKKEKPAFTLAEVSLGNISQEVSETGQVKKGDQISLSFKNVGKVEKIYVTVGEDVKAGDILAKEESTQLRIQLQDAKSALVLVQAQLNKLLAGASPEEIQAAKTSVSNAQISLEDAEINLRDVESQTEENSDVAYEDAQNVLEDAYLKAYNAENSADSIQKTYFTSNDQESLKVKENSNKILEDVSLIKSYLNAAEKEDIDTALSETKTALDDISGALKIIRETCEESIYIRTVSSTDKTSLDTQKGYINTAITNVTSSEQTISSTRLTNEAGINTAKSNVSTVRGSLAVAQDNLSLVLAPPRKEDVDLNQAKVDQAESQVQILENQIQDTILRSPTSGKIALINKREGELIQPISQDSIITLIPESPFVIEANIYEEDVVKVTVGNPVAISLVAFPEETFKGKVVSIDPSQKLIEGVIYYEVTIDFDTIPDGIKPGMTADIVIRTASKENVLIIPESAIQKENGKIFVQVSKDGKSENREIKIGLQGTNGIVEVVSGLEKGEKLIIQ